MSESIGPSPHAPAAAAEQRHQRQLSQQTRGEHDELLAAMHQLEAALASPAPFREREWAARASQDLASVRGNLERHILSAEGTGGLFAELDLTRCGMRVAELRQEHQTLLERARDLERALRRDDQTPDFAALRGQAAEFLTAIRRHHSREVDLIYECFWLDIGVGD